MKKIFTFLLYLFFSTPDYAQIRRDAVWCFGDSVQIDFNQTPPLLDYCATRSRGSACSISDSSGNLLFYAHTFYILQWQSGFHRLGVVWNKNHELMENGDSLVGSGWYKEMIIVPDPADSQLFYLFHTDEGIYKALFYSIIDLSYNNGLGKITQKNMFLDSLNERSVTDGVTAIKHGNGRDWWLIFRTYGGNGNPDNTFYKFLITPIGISPAMTQNIGFPTQAGFLNLTFNNKGNQMILIDAAGLIELYDFDRCSGNLSNLRSIHAETFNVQDANWAAEFSPNDSVLYVTTNEATSYLYQYNLSASPISSSRTTISVDSFPLYSAGALKAAKDGRIYRANTFYDGYFPFPYPDSVYNQYNMNLSVINQPNVLGVGCDFQPYSFYLGGHRTYWGLPNNPNYDMIALGGSVCDTLGLPNDVRDFSRGGNGISVYPNPVSEFLNVQYELVKSENITVRLTDLAGRVVLSKKLENKMVDVRSVSNGIYSLSFYANKQLLSSLRVTILH